MTNTAEPIPLHEDADPAEAAKLLQDARRKAAQSVVTAPTVSSKIDRTLQSYAKLGAQMPFEVLGYIQIIARYNPDFSQAVENLKTLANSGHELFVKGNTELAERRAKSYLEEQARKINPAHGGIDGLIDKLLWQAAVFGAMCGEWVLNEDMTEVVDFADINPKSIRFFWDNDDVYQGWAPYQEVKPEQAKEAENAGQKVRQKRFVRLNPLTFHYYAFDPDPNSPYGVPPFLAALRNIGIQDDMVTNMSQIVKKMGLLGIVDMSIKALQKKRGEDDAAFIARATAYLESYAAAAEEMVTDGGLVHFDDAEVKTTSITGNGAGATNIFKQNEEQIFSGLKSMPSVQGRSYCVVPGTKVLTADLRWVAAGSLELGDELVGFDEHLGKGQGRGNVARLHRSTVEVNRRIFLPCVKVTTDRGSITVSKQHPLVAMDRSRGRVWREAADLRVGDRLSWFGAPWAEDCSYEAGYVAGMFDGEGTLGKNDGVRNTSVLRLAQLEGPVLGATELAMKELGYTTSTMFKKQENGKTIGVLSLLGGRYENMRFLGSIRPHRFMAKAHRVWENAMLRNSGTSAVKHDDHVTVVSIEDVGEREVVALQTSTRTFIAEGLLNHNSTTETYAGVAYDIIIRNTHKYQRAVKRMIESGYWLMLDLAGLRATSVKIQFNPNKTLHRLQSAQAQLLEIRAALMLWAIGIFDQQDVAQYLGYSDVKEAYEDIPESAILGNSSPGGGAGNTSTETVQPPESSDSSANQSDLLKMLIAGLDPELADVVLSVLHEQKPEFPIV